MINLIEYFKRIGYQPNGKEGELPTPTLETLRAIHRAQVFSIPFEDLVLHQMVNFEKEDVLKEDVIKLDEQSIFNKLVVDNRGGYCHENNELLALVLLQLGFKVERLCARVLDAPVELPKGHKLLLVTIDNKKYIADVGYGGNGLLEPVALDNVYKEFKQGIDTFKLIKEDEDYVLQVKIKNEFKSQYAFSLQIYKKVDFEPINYAISHRSNSIFVRTRMCIKPTEFGRVILVDDILKIRTKLGTYAIKIKNDDDYLFALKDYFDIDLGKDAQLKALPVKGLQSLPAKQTQLGKKLYLTFSSSNVSAFTSSNASKLPANDAITQQQLKKV